jgi:hypothetical protein
VIQYHTGEFLFEVVFVNEWQVHREWLSDDAAGVIAHIIDMFKKNECQTSVKTSIRARTMTPTYHQ